MDEVIARIKGYVLVIKSDLTDDDFLDFVVNDVIDRALAYMNRDQLIWRFEEDIEDYPDFSDDFWINYEYPIPKRLERALASAIVGAYKTVDARNSADSGVVTRLKDNGQEVDFNNEMASFLSSSDDSEVFSGTIRLLREYSIPKIVGGVAYDNEYTKPL
jgi:hypothetical protein